MNSWDCFDTLIARKYITPESVFLEVANRLNDQEFVQKRKKAEKNVNYKTFENIYKNLPEVDPQTELDVEYEHAIPIRKNIDLVKDGDYIVSDMYLPKDFILQLLRKCGLNKKITLIVTPNGKKSGKIWSTLPKFCCHYGDNRKTDVESPKKYNIMSNYVRDSNLTDIEKKVYKSDKELASLIRSIRLDCPYKKDFEIKLWNDQTNFNIPILILGSLELPPDKKICFTYRDCVYWRKIYTAMFNSKESNVLHASRKCYYFPKEGYREYVESVINGCYLVDIKGSGESPNAFFKGNNNVTYLVGTKIKIPNKSIIGSGKWKDTIERLNLSELGPITDFKNGEIIRGKTEHNNTIISVQKLAIEYASLKVNEFKVSRNLDLLKCLVDLSQNIFTNSAVNTFKSTRDEIIINGKKKRIRY